MSNHIQGRRRYDLAVLKDPSGKLVYTRLMGALGTIAAAGEVKAVCLMNRDTDVGKCLQTNHGCGHNISKLPDPHNGTGNFIAEVVGWGKFIEGELGWRTEYMEIIGIWCPKGTEPEVMMALEEYYKCPILVPMESNDF